jgi:hypothetical protein
MTLDVINVVNEKSNRVAKKPLLDSMSWASMWMMRLPVVRGARRDEAHTAFPGE